MWTVLELCVGIYAIAIFTFNLHVKYRYYQLLSTADRLLMDCQRRVYQEPGLAKAIQILTNLQVHVLNPVDMLRAPMDEGVLCFPYGLILDKAFELLAQVETMMAGKGEDLNSNWERLAELSKRAQLHYRRFVEVSLSLIYNLNATQPFRGRRKGACRRSLDSRQSSGCSA